MSDLAGPLAALAESLEPTTATDHTSAAAVAHVTEILVMPLDRFARDGQCLEIRVPWLDITFWFVPEERDAAAIVRTGAGRGQVWTASELTALMALPDRTPEIVRSLVQAKRAFDGDIVEVRR